MAINYKHEGDHITVVESAIVHASRSGSMVNAGDAVVVNQLHGVALLTATANTDNIPVATEGVWSLSATGNDGSTSSAIAIGNKVYIDGSAATINKDSSKVFFGIALGAVAGAATAAIDIKLVH